MAVKMLNVPSLPNIPWQEKPADYKLSSPVWRYSENPVMGRNPTPEIARIFNSAVVPWEDGYIAVLRGEQVNAKKCPLWMTTATRKCRTTPMTRVW